LDADIAAVASAELLEQLGDAVTILGPDWRYRYVSAGAALIIGRPAAEVVGLHVWDEVFPEVVGTPQYDAAVRAMQTRTRENIVWFFDTVGRWYSQLAIPVGDGLVFVVGDVTESKAAESRAEVLLRGGEELARASTFTEVAAAVLRHPLAHVRASSGGVLLVDEARGVVRSLGLQSPDPQVLRRWTEYPLELETPGTDAWRSGRPVHVASVYEARQRYPNLVDDLLASGRRSVSAYPLTSGGERIGVLVAAFDDEHVAAEAEDRFLSTAAAMAAQALLRVRLLDVERRSVQALQRSLLPGSLPTLQGLDVAVRYLASDVTAEVGGDWYDVVQLPGDGVGLVLGDVEGHDLGAAAIMGLVRGAVRAYALDGYPPALVLERANAFLGGLELGRLVTVSYAQLYPTTGLVTSVSAGHPPTLVVEPGRPVRHLPTETGPPLGVVSDGHLWPETTSQVQDRAALALFTDGLVELRGRDIDEGIAHVERRLQELQGSAAADIADQLLALRPAAAHDDVALVVARLTRATTPGRVVRRQLPARPASVHLARRFARQVLEAWAVPIAVVERAGLAVSELVTNGARHSEDALEVSLQRDDDRLRIVVFDTSHRLPDAAASGPVAEDATSGRGLMLVEAVADRWGVDSTGLSKRVWAEFDLPGESGSARA
jgi:serine phosphatase RsbU (regulator of sigma subunit)/anti-sigma regulatory factor (Ser/Thr protein kinase)